jgi:predicted N-acetyltransferase YhbS
MSAPQFEIVPERPGDQPLVENLLDAVFGLSRRTKTSYRLREGEKPVAGLSFVALGGDGRLVGAIGFWHVRIGTAGTPALLLGPLAVCPALQGKGIGRALMRHGLTLAKEMGHRLVILVGDEPYYARVGFRRLPEGRLILPGPVDPARFLYLELEPHALAGVEGLVLPPSRFAEAQAQRPSRYHMSEAAASSSARLASVENSGSSLTARTR